jgi:hypothetical protein
MNDGSNRSQQLSHIRLVLTAVECCSQAAGGGLAACTFPQEGGSLIGDHVIMAGNTPNDLVEMTHVRHGC